MKLFTNKEVESQDLYKTKKILEQVAKVRKKSNPSI